MELLSIKITETETGFSIVVDSEDEKLRKKWKKRLLGFFASGSSCGCGCCCCCCCCGGSCSCSCCGDSGKGDAEGEACCKD